MDLSILSSLAVLTLLGGCAFGQPGVREVPLPVAVPAAGGTVFEDATAELGLAIGNGAAAWGDFDNDGFADLYADGTLWRNNRGVKFTKMSTPTGGSSGVWGDFDNDGFLDLYCWGNGKLFRNEGGLKFVDVTGMLPPNRPTEVCRGAVWGDFDRDGFLDLFVGGYEVWPSKEYPDVIYLNAGGRSFTELWRTNGRIFRARGITAADYDEDGYLDVYVSNYRLQPNHMWRNKGEWRDAGDKFDEVAKSVHVDGRLKRGCYGHTIGSAFGDLDSDGHLDLFVGNFSHLPDYQDRPKFLQNLGPKGEWKFADRSLAAGLKWQESFASPALGDFDNDGWLDLFFTTVYPRDDSVLYRNTGGWKFVDVTASTGVKSRLTYQAAWCDFDNDGDLDLVTHGKLYRNRGNGNHRLKVVLRGAGECNRAAIGAQVRARYGESVQVRQICGGTGEGNQNDLSCHFGLGRYDGAIELDIRWPDGSRQVVRTGADRTITIEKQGTE